MLCLDQNHQACFDTTLFETCLHKSTLKALRTTLEELQIIAFNNKCLYFSAFSAPLCECL